MQRTADSAELSTITSQGKGAWQLLAGLIGIAALASCATTEQLVVVELLPPDVEFEEGFTYITSVRELHDGRIIISDPREQRLLVVDLTTMEMKPVARRGAGPREWLTAVALHPLGGDSSLQMDPISRRWALFEGTEIVHIVPQDAPVIAQTDGVASGADGFGRVYKIRAPAPSAVAARTIGASDSVAFVRLAIDGGKDDTVTMLRDAPGKVHSTVTESGELRPVAISRPAFAVGEQAIAFVDGAVAVLRLDPYRVDWHFADGSISRGAPIARVRKPFDSRAREEYLLRNSETIESLKRAPEEMREVLMTRFTEFPEHYPPFLPFSAVAGADGRVYIQRADLGDSAQVHYDVIDRAGNLIRRLALLRNERILTVSERFIYVVWQDEDGVERIRRHPRRRDLVSHGVGAATRTLADKWTIVTLDGSMAGHFEHTVAVTDAGPRVLTTL